MHKIICAMLIAIIVIQAVAIYDFARQTKDAQRIAEGAESIARDHHKGAVMAIDEANKWREEAEYWHKAYCDIAIFKGVDHE